MLKFFKQFNDWRPARNEWLADQLSQEANKYFPYKCLCCGQSMKEYGYCSTTCMEAITTAPEQHTKKCIYCHKPLNSENHVGYCDLDCYEDFGDAISGK